MKLINLQSAWAILLCFTLILSSCSDDDNDSSTPTDGEQASFETQILTLVNEHRKSLSLTELSINQTAERLALEHANSMVDLEEVNADGRRDRIDQLRETENALTVAEFNARFYTPEELVNEWLDTESNKNLIETEKFAKVGIAAVKDQNDRYYYTFIMFDLRN